MVKRTKLTLEHPATKAHVKEADFPESAVTEQPVASGRQSNLRKMLIVAGLTIVSLIIFKQKIF